MDSRSPSQRARKRRRSPDMVEPDLVVTPNNRNIIGEEERFIEYDDHAWVAAANGIAAELARTNDIMEKSIGATEGTRDAIVRMTRSVEGFMEAQMEFQRRLIEGLNEGLGIDASVDTPDRQSDAEGDVDGTGEAALSSGSIEV